MKFLHTADIQLGLKLHFVPGENGVRVRSQRFDTLRHIADVAKERDVQAVIVAGDFFDDNSVGPDTIQLAEDSLQIFAPIPVLILPGNHDAATEHSALKRLLDLKHVHVLVDQESVEIEGALFYPCPLTRRHETSDPTSWLPDRGAGDDRIRVAIAHGRVIEFSESAESPNLIDADAVLKKGFDYLALGDWHGTFKFRDNAWYPGTPEATRWTEKDPGNVLLIDIPASGEVANVEKVPVGRTRWVDRKIVFDRDEEVDDLAKWLESLDEKSWTLVQLTMSGHLSLKARTQLDQLLEDNQGRLLCLRIREDRVTAAPTEEDLQDLKLEGFVGTAVDMLKEDESQESQDALRLLYRFQVEAGDES